MPAQKRINGTGTAQIRCWVYGDDDKNTFFVTIRKSDTVSVLKDCIRAKISEFPRVHAKDLRLYCVPACQFQPAYISPDDLEETRLSSEIQLKSLLHCVIIIDGPRSITLNYWVHGDLASQIESIQLFEADTVQTLKRALVDDFSDVPARNLLLYKFPPLPEASTLKSMLRSLKISSLDLLPNTHILSDIFKSSDSCDMPHFLVFVTSRVLSIQCWIRGSDTLTPFDVKLGINETVNLLKQEIKKTYTGCLDASADHLDLYKIAACEEGDLPEVLGDIRLGYRLKGDTRLWTIVKEMSLSESLHVVVQVSADESSGSPPSAFRSIKVDNNPIVRARRNFLMSVGCERPLRSGMPSSFRSRQRDPGMHKAIACGHPNSIEDVIPPALLHPIFGRFVDDCESIKPTFEDNLFAEELARAMSELYDGEAERVRAVTKVFAQYGIPFVVADKATYPVDSFLSVGNHRYVIAEYKNEAGNTSSEPYFQAIGYYVESTRETAITHCGSPLPTLLLAIFGPYIEFSAAAWNLRPAVQLLTDPISFKFYSTDTMIQPSVARRLAAFRRATRRLKKYYEKLQETPHVTSPHLFPYPTSYGSGPAEKSFTYVKHLDDKKLIFEGTEGSDSICIKFVHSYSREAHEFLAGQGCAPALRGFQKLAGGWFLVVMELLKDHETLRDRVEPLPPSVLEAIGAKLALLHKFNYVHGDIRDTNIMVFKYNEKIFMIVDFDWAGKIGEVRYPVGINFRTIIRPSGARDGQLIRVAHDEFMVLRLRGQIPLQGGEQEDREEDELEGELSSG